MEADSRFPYAALTSVVLLLLFSVPVQALPDSPKGFLASQSLSNATHRFAIVHALLADVRTYIWSWSQFLWSRPDSPTHLFHNNFWSMVTAATILGALPCVVFWKRHARRGRTGWPSSSSEKDISDTVGLDAVASDPGLLKKHSEFRSFTTSRFTYPSIRTFFRPHPQGSKLPINPTPLPLLVFIHGLGGSVAQFHPILVSLVNVAPCLSIDLPGCGLSKFAPTSWDAYSIDSLVRLLACAIESYRDIEAGQEVILVGHSMGCSLAALLASTSSPYRDLVTGNVIGLIAICPQATPPGPEDVQKFKLGLNIPGPVFDLWRRWDRRGGTESASVRRFVGEGAEEETKKLQVRFNKQSKTSVWRRMARGCLPDYSSGVAEGGIPGKEIWAGLKLPLFLAAGESDHVTRAENLNKIAEYLGKNASRSPTTTETLPDSAAPVDLDASAAASANQAYNLSLSSSIVSSEGTLGSLAIDEKKQTDVTNIESTRFALKTTVLPAPASHALLYSPMHSRILAGLISSFLADHIDMRLSLGWQLQYLTTEGKWDVKNLAKWRAVTPVSEPIAGVFRAMKTLREVDEVHCPKVFVNDWQGKIGAVVDISHESPVYDPKGLEDGGIRYHKFPTVSKLPPQVDEVESFITLVDQIRQSRSDSSSRKDSDALIGVHCHYGFNRTGFFLVCYMIERLGFELQDALEEFERCRPPGIRHGHFIDTLHVRYCVGLRRAPTL